MYPKGQKLVVIIQPPVIATRGAFAGLPVKIVPEIDEIVTSAGVNSIWKDSIDLVEYPKGKYGICQGFYPKYFAPLEEWNEAQRAVEELLNEIEVEAQAVKY